MGDKWSFAFKTWPILRLGQINRLHTGDGSTSHMQIAGYVSGSKNETNEHVAAGYQHGTKQQKDQPQV